MHATWLGDLKYEWLGYARPLGPSLGVGSVSIAYFHMPGIAGFDEFNNPTGDFKVYDMAFTVGLARPVGKMVSVGANAKLIRQNLASVSATGVATDLGATVNVSGTTFGAVIQNLGPSLSFGGASYRLPQQIRFGASRGFLDGRVLLATDYNMPNDYYHDFRIGTELRAHPNVSLRAGYRRELGSSDDPATGLSYGLGFNLKQMTVDYAMTPSDAFDDVHRISFGYSFGSGAKEREAEPQKPEETKPVPPPVPTGPPIIAQAKPEPPAPKAVEAPIAPPKPSAPAPVAPAAPPAQPSVLTPEELAIKPPAVQPGYAVVLPGFQSKESAQAEMKALELLGFRTKDAQVSRDPKRGGYVITLSRLKSRGKADEMAASLQRMSFRATVEVVGR